VCSTATETPDPDRGTPFIQTTAFTYTITAVVNRNGQPVREERTISVIAGQTTTVNFTQPAGT
jgi:hypothetical protein